MQTLAAAWTEAGGAVIGLAPSAAAAAQLRDQIGGVEESMSATSPRSPKTSSRHGKPTAAAAWMRSCSTPPASWSASSASAHAPTGSTQNQTRRARSRAGGDDG